MRKNMVFLHRRCEVTLKHEFVLSGTIIDIDDFGIMFQTSQKTSWLAWDIIERIVPLE